MKKATSKAKGKTQNRTRAKAHDAVQREPKSEADRATARLASDYWRMLRQFERALAIVPDERRNRFAAQIRYSAGRLAAFGEEAGYRVIAHDGSLFSPEMPATVVNEDEVAGDKPLVVADTIEPTVLYDGKVVLMGRVIVKEAP